VRAGNTTLNGRRVPYINEVRQITESGLDIDTEMLYSARFYQQGDAWFTRRINPYPANVEKKVS
jgi:hypothetical protein